MAVISVAQVWDGRAGEAGTERRAYTNVYEVITNDPTDDFATIRNSGQLPALWEAKSGDAVARLQNFRGQQNPDTPCQWYVYGEFSTRAPVTGGTDGHGTTPDQSMQEDPLARPCEIDLVTEEQMKPIQRDLDEKLIATYGTEVQTVGGDSVTVGVAIDPLEGVTIEDQPFILTLKKNRAFVSYANIVQYRRAVNSDVFIVWNPGRLRIKYLSLRAHFDKGQFYWEQSARIAVLDEEEYAKYGPADILRLLNHGPHYLLKNADGVVTGRRRFNAAPSNQPAMGMIKHDGTQAAVGAEYWNDFRVRPRLPYAGLGFF